MTFPLGDHYDYQSYFKIGWFFFFRFFVDFTFDSIHKIKKRKKKLDQHEAIRASRMISNAYISNSPDDDECTANIGGCDQVCSNTNGSFSCSCHMGFFLDSNGKTCRGRLHFFPCIQYYHHRYKTTIVVRSF